MSVSENDLALYGKAVEHAPLRAGEYTSPEEYDGQGDTRVVRDMMFSYDVVVQDPAGNNVREPREAYRRTELSVEAMGLLALEKGERNHSFYTTAELEVLRGGNEPRSGGQPQLDKAGMSELGEYELAEWLAGEAEGQTRPPGVNEVLEEVGSDKEFAHRVLQAENIRTDGDPRRGLEVGLKRVIGG